MTQQLPPGQEADEIQALAGIVAESLDKGEDPHAIAQQLIDSGWESDEANSFVGSIQQQLQQAHSVPAGGSAGSEAKGWLIWIGAIGGINLLSYLFDWGFWIY